MPFLPTNALMAALKARLQTLRQAEGSDAPLFERVDIIGAGGVTKGMQSIFASEARVCFIVPSFEEHLNAEREGLIYTQRRTTLTLLISDRVASANTTEAVTGGVASVGVVALKEAVIDDLFAYPFTDTPGLAFVPARGDLLTLTPPEHAANNLGREVWQQLLTAYAGNACQTLP